LIRSSSGTIKTYARRPERSPSFHDRDFPRKRIRMDMDGTAVEEYLNVPAEDPPTIASEDRVPSSSTAPSSSPPPNQDLLFSDPVTGQDPGSESSLSPPLTQLASPKPAPKKPTFSFLKRKRSLRSQDIPTAASEALTDIAPNIQSDAPRPTKKTRFTQMQIDLGGEVQKTCKACGMEYILSNKEDAALHKEFHAMNIGGVDVGKKFLSSKDGGLKRAYPRDKRWLNEGEDMVMVDRKSPLWARNKVKKVLEVVNTELGSADIEDAQLWATLAPNAEHFGPKSKKKRDSDGADKAGERYKAFLHIEKEKCIGLCLAEKISNARRVVDPKVDEDREPTNDPTPRSSSISTSADLDLALLGITRIWTSKSHRGRGIAGELLETARGNFFYGMEVPKELVAFSQPTESGGKLAERWFGSRTGWHVVQPLLRGSRTTLPLEQKSVADHMQRGSDDPESNSFISIVMSGTNPFRRKDIPEASSARPHPLVAGDDPVVRAGLRFPTLDTDLPRSIKTKKAVRIVSPQYSRAKEGHSIPTITSPPPKSPIGSPPLDTESPSSEESSPIDPFSPQSDEGTSQKDDEDLQRNTVANATSINPQPALNLNLPINPTRKAPALQFGGDGSTLGEQPERTISAAVTGRPHYDVDEFKRLLLTGEKLNAEKIRPISSPPAHVQGLQLGDSNCNTDASSVSRQSIFEPHSDINAESPGTSMDIPLSDDERHGLVQPSPNVGRNRPLVPPSRHGKLVKQNVPQTVSFESLSSFPADPTLPPILSMKPVSPTSPIDTKDPNKPLPLPPRSVSPKPIEYTPDSSTIIAEEPEASLTPPQHPSRIAEKRSPPALPAARRHGQARSRSSTNESSRSTSNSEEMPQYTYPSPSNSSSTTSSKPPPLPPPRRAGTNPTQENRSPVSSVFPAIESTEAPPFKPRPPAAPSRTPSMTSIKRMSRISASSGSSGIAPPPPPRRRGSSQSQNNFAPSRLSGEYRIPSSERNRSGSSASSTQQPSVPETSLQGKDIIADLTALQREVDELRGKFGR
ncbi:MAG: hypothetical protein LQ343_006741, partial [Gyalolechia ehrenbergii]